MSFARAVDVLPVIRSSRFDTALTYDAGTLDLTVGDVVYVPLGARTNLAFVVEAPRAIASSRELRTVTARAGIPRAFDEAGLQLARFVADRYVCTLGEALGAVVLSAALPRTAQRLIPSDSPNPKRYPSVPQRLLNLLWSNGSEGFTLEQLLRNPEARRCGDRAALLRHIAVLVRSGDLRRERRILRPRTQEYRVRTLFAGSSQTRGHRTRALVEFVSGDAGVPRADALLAGFSQALIAKAVRAGALVQRDVARAHAPRAARPRSARMEPTLEQERAIAALRASLAGGEYAEILLHGITGSGKTLVYIEAIDHVLSEGGRALILVPEISLTPQTARRFEDAFADRVAVLHSALSERERFEAWKACARGDVSVVVGARSAVFAPLDRLRLLIVDEAHESSYKQDTVPRYHAVEVARERMRNAGGLLVLGSATPSLESYAAATAGRTRLIALTQRATRQSLPAITVVDMTKEFDAGNRRIFSAALTQAIGERLDRGEKIVLFVNRRGSAGFLLCRHCGAVPRCPRCSVSLSVHRSEGLLRCHYCDLQRRLPNRCPACGDESLREFGVGTERVAQEVQRLFPSARVVRMDSDTTTRIGDHARLLDEFGEHADVLVGTQMVAKGLDFAAVTLVGVVAADLGLHAPDFRAAERTFALITQVCGRSGRASPGEAIVQTYSPAHPAIVHASGHDYSGFARMELAERAALRYPPSSELLYVGIIGADRNHTLARARGYAEELGKGADFDVLGPAPYPIARVNGQWRFRIALKGTSSAVMRDALRERIVPVARKEQTTRLIVNVDP